MQKESRSRYPVEDICNQREPVIDRAGEGGVRQHYDDRPPIPVDNEVDTCCESRGTNV